MSHIIYIDRCCAASLLPFIYVHASRHVYESIKRIVSFVELWRGNLVCHLLRSCRRTRRTGCCDCSGRWWAIDCRARRADCCRAAAAACSSAARTERQRRPPGTPCPASRTPEPCGRRTGRTERRRTPCSPHLKKTARYLKYPFQIFQILGHSIILCTLVKCLYPK